MRINKPLSLDKIKMGNLLSPGIYEFEVIKAEEKPSQAGNDMIKLVLKIFTPNGDERIIYDNLLEILEWKLAHFCEAVGLFNDYENHVISADKCEGKKGRAKIYIQKDKNGVYADKNAVADYVINKSRTELPTEIKLHTVKKDESCIDDYLPF
jgi:hypothetical protein